jgi:hypothetical protein
MSIIKDTFFGGAEKKAAKAQQQGIERGIDETRRATEEARQAVTPLFGQARQDLNQGFQGALDVFSQSLPAQMQTFQQGNVGAQEQLLAGLPQFQNAILGNQIDFSQLQPAQVQTPDLGFFQQTLPQIQQQQQLAAMNSGLGPYTPDNPIFNNRMGPFEMAGSTSRNAIDGLMGVMGNDNSQLLASSPEFIPRGPGDTFARSLERQQPRSVFGGLSKINQHPNLFAVGGN